MVRQSVGQYVAVVLVLLALSCAAGAEKTQLTLAVWTWQETFERLIDEFEALHPDIEVELIVTASLNAYRDRIPAMYGERRTRCAMVHSSDFVASSGCSKAWTVHWAASPSMSTSVLHRRLAMGAGSYTVGHGPYAMPSRIRPSACTCTTSKRSMRPASPPRRHVDWDTELDARHYGRDFGNDGTADQVDFRAPAPSTTGEADMASRRSVYRPRVHREPVHTRVMEALNFVNLRLSGVQVDVGARPARRPASAVSGSWAPTGTRSCRFPGRRFAPEASGDGHRTIGARRMASASWRIRSTLMRPGNCQIHDLRGSSGLARGRTDRRAAHPGCGRQPVPWRDSAPEHAWLELMPNDASTRRTTRPEISRIEPAAGLLGGAAR